MNAPVNLDQLSELDNVILLLLKFAKNKQIHSLNDAQINKAVYNLQIKSLEFVGEKFCDVRYHRAERGPISPGIKESLNKLSRLGLINSTNEEVGLNKYAHKHTLLNDSFTNVIRESKVLFALSTFQLLEKKYPKFRNSRGEATTLGSYETEPMKHILNLESEKKRSLVGQPIDFHQVSLNKHILDIL